jgi:hypothetical protein
MNTFLILARTLVCVLILALMTTSHAVAQAHKARPRAATHKTSTSASQPTKPKPMAATQSPKANPTGSENPTATGHQPTPTREEILESLHSTRARLSQVEQEYRGRRDRAIREVESALKLLGQPPGTAPSRVDKVETQSDEPLVEAHRLLQSLESRMSSKGINDHQYKQAKDAIQNAVRELNLALVDR